MNDERSSERWSSGAAPAEPVDLAGAPLSVEDRQRILSARRIKLTLIVFVVALLLVLSTVVFLGVTRIFDWLTPTIRHDLERKARRGVVELAQTAQIGVVVRDRAVIVDAARDYLEDADVLGLAVLDAEGKSLLAHGGAARRARAALGQKPYLVFEDREAFSAWAPSVIEGTEVGRVAIVVSKARLEAGMRLRRDVLMAGGLSCLVALVVCLLFVNLYIGPILRFTSDVIRRLERTTEAALSAARIKSQFLANMSHEIRTPMNGIVGVLDLMRRTPLSAKQQRYAETMESSARGLLTIVDDILDFSKLEAGKYNLREEDFGLRQLAQEVVELLAPRAHAKHVELVLRLDAEAPDSVHGDPDRVKQVLTNLIGNAIKFTEQGHVVLRIGVDAKTDAGLQLRFAVEDSGVGIAREDLGKLFGLFSQVDASMTRKFGGTGLGLAISKRLVEVMGGEIGVQSQFGQGSTFWFVLPTRAGKLAAAPSLPPRKARVLLVSSDEAQREALWEQLSGWGMSCVAADGPQQASALLVAADSAPFDAAVIDALVELPGELPAEAAEGLGLLDLCMTEGVPVVRLLSSVQGGRGEEPLGLLRVGLTKPVRASELYNGLIALMDGLPLTKRPRRALEFVELPERPRTSCRDPVLVVDDNEINRTVAVEMLLDLGYAAETACDGRDALTKATRGGYAAILMDCQMPILDGYEATRAIRSLPGAEARVPIIALTAHAMVGDRQKVLAAGMDDYTSKPVRARALSNVLARWVRGEAMTAGSAASSAAGSAAEPSVPPEGPSSADPSALPLPDVDPNVPRSAHVIGLFCELTPQLLDELEQAAAAGNLDRVRAAAHKLKGSCLSLGAPRLAALSHTVERAALAGKLDTTAIAELDESFARAREGMLRSAPTAAREAHE